MADFPAAGLVTPAFALHYRHSAARAVAGGTPGLLRVGKSFSDPAFEIEYRPDGVYSGLCAGVASTAAQKENVTLQECGASPKTVWAVDMYDQPIESFFRHTPR